MPHRIYGLNTFVAFCLQAPEQLVRVWHRPALAAVIKKNIKLLPAAQTFVAQPAPDAQLEKLAQSTHHEGVVFEIKMPQMAASAHDFITQFLRSSAPVMLILEGVSNPHNLGSCLRTCSFLGSIPVAFSSPSFEWPLPAAVYRVSEGGALHSPVFATHQLLSFCLALKKSGVILAAATPHTTSTWAQIKQQLKSESKAGKQAIVLGGEKKGLSLALLQACQHQFQIPKASQAPMDSLNLAVFAGITLYDVLNNK